MSVAVQNINNPKGGVFEFAISVLVGLAIPFANYQIRYCTFKNNGCVCPQQFLNLQFHPHLVLQVQKQQTCESTAVFEFALALENYCIWYSKFKSFLVVFLNLQYQLL
jgi:hypothetical protein